MLLITKKRYTNYLAFAYNGEMPAKLRKDGREHYQILPDSVLYDAELPGDAVRVYALLIGSMRGSNWVSVGIRLIASELSITPKTAGKSLRVLIERGHIERRAPLSVVKGTERGAYHPTSSVFRSGKNRVPFSPPNE